MESLKKLWLSLSNMLLESPELGSRGTQAEATRGRGASPSVARRASGGNYVSPKTNKKIALFLIGLLFIVFSGSRYGFAQTEIEAAKTKLKKGTTLLRRLDSSLKNEQGKLSSVKSNIKDAKKKLQDTTLKIRDLTAQLFNIQNVSEESQRKQLAMKRQIAVRENELQTIRETLARKRIEHRGIFQKMQTFGTYAILESSENDLSSLSWLIAFENTGEGFNRQLMANLAKDYTVRLFKENDRVNRELLLTAQKLTEKTQALAALEKRLEAEARNLEYHKEARKHLLLATKGQQDIYEELLEASKLEQKEVFEVIQNLKENYSYVEKKLEDVKQKISSDGSFSLEDYQSATEQIPLNLTARLQWPVSPSLGISAYFHDEGYRKSIGIPHEGIDIRVAQGSKVRAAQTGVVYKVKNSEDASYNYVILAHRNGLLTLYGHLSDVLVKEGDTVFVGEAFAISGGIPGTRGAGWLTTGAHVHLEVFENWKHMDPLDYLPLEYLPLEYIPKKHLEKISGLEEEKVNRTPVEKVRRAPKEAL